MADMICHKVYEFLMSILTTFTVSATPAIPPFQTGSEGK
jgi:hypothetical protein